MFYFKQLGKGLKSTLILQWIICAALWSLSIVHVQAAGALWQNPYTGRVISLPVGVHVEWGGVNADIVVFDDYKNDISIHLFNGDGAEYNESGEELSPNGNETANFTPNGRLNGYPISTYGGNSKRPCEFFIQIGEPIWSVRFFHCDQPTKYSQLRALFDVILPSMIQLKSDEAFELIIPWSERKIKLAPNKPSLNSWNAYATHSLLVPDSMLFHSFFVKTSKDSKNYDGLVNIYGDNVDILVSSRQVAPENLEAQLTASTLKEDNNGAIIAYKKTKIGGRTVLKGQYINEWGWRTKLETHYLIALKNRIWTVVSSVYEDDKGNYPNAAQRINIIEQLIATLPDNPTDIVTIYTNPQTKKQLKVPKGWAVMQDFSDGLPKDIGIVELDKVDGASSISYECGPQFVSVLKYSMKDNDYYRKARFANRDVFIRDDISFDLYTKDKAGACHLEINIYDKEKDEDKLAIAEKLFATENY